MRTSPRRGLRPWEHGFQGHRAYEALVFIVSVVSANAKQSYHIMFYTYGTGRAARGTVEGR